jgi:hypothetical protein
MGDNLEQFNKEIDEFCQTIPDKVNTVQKVIVLEALKRLVEKTPVKTGRARGNWQATIDAAAEGQLEVTDIDGQATISKGLSILGEMQPYCIVWISNNVDYIEFLEDGSSKQAPEGMLAITVEELMQMFEGVIE